MEAFAPQPIPMPTPAPIGGSTPAPVAQNDNDTAIKQSPIQRTATHPEAANDDDFPSSSGSSRPLHTQTQQTLSPTSEFMRYILAALPSRYVLRGFFKTIFDTSETTGRVRSGIANALRAPGVAIEKLFFGKGPRDAASIKNNMQGLEAGSYGASLGFGSMALTYSYSRIVERDIKNLFAETVGDELGKPADTVSFQDIQTSENKIIQRTLENFRQKKWSRYATDLLFFPAGWMHKEGLVDVALGIKGVQLFMDTWKRKTTMFEDLVTFVNNKINPRNGLGQPITQGELFDLYQHYADTFHSVKMFTNVLERGTGEGKVWAGSQPIFQRMTELMNETYAYKHRTEIDPTTGHTIHKADFTLPKFIMLLGNDFIDPAKPTETLALIEVANRYGSTAAKQVGTALRNGATLEAALESYPVTLPSLQESAVPESGKNGVIAKGSTLQLDGAEGHVPHSKIAVDSIAGHSHTVAREAQHAIP